MKRVEATSERSFHKENLVTGTCFEYRGTKGDWEHFLQIIGLIDIVIIKISDCADFI